jgi:hypothetical protein
MALDGFDSTRCGNTALESFRTRLGELKTVLLAFEILLEKSGSLRFAYHGSFSKINVPGRKTARGWHLGSHRHLRSQICVASSAKGRSFVCVE